MVGSKCHIGMGKEGLSAQLKAEIIEKMWLAYNYALLNWNFLIDWSY